MNYADIKYPDIQDGTGIRIAIYVSGCHFHCPECHNKMAWNPNYGKEFTDDTIKYIIDKFAENEDYTDGLSLLGGEPLEEYNQEGLLKLTTEFRKRFPTKDIWCWTGYDFDKDVLNKMFLENEITRRLLANIDIIVDGQFVKEKNMIDLIARGSYNQRKIDVKESIKNGQTVYLTFGDEYRYENITNKPKVIFIKDFSKNETEEPAFIPVASEITEVFDISKPEKIVIQKNNIQKISAKNIDGENFIES